MKEKEECTEMNAIAMELTEASISILAAVGREAAIGSGTLKDPKSGTGSDEGLERCSNAGIGGGNGCLMPEI